MTRLGVLVHGFIIHIMKMLNVFSVAEHRLGKVSKLLRKSSKDKSNYVICTFHDSLGRDCCCRVYSTTDKDVKETNWVLKREKSWPPNSVIQDKRGGGCW